LSDILPKISERDNYVQRCAEATFRDGGLIFMFMMTEGVENLNSKIMANKMPGVLQEKEAMTK
jgi:hypothetical protein